MGNLNANAMGDLALASVQFAAGTPSYSVQRGFASTAITDNGTGDSTLTLANAQALSTAAVVFLSFNIATGAIGSVEVATATTVRVRTWSLTIASPAVSAAADIDYWIRITPISPN